MPRRLRADAPAMFPGRSGVIDDSIDIPRGLLAFEEAPETSAPRLAVVDTSTLF